MAARHDQDRLADAVGEFLASEAVANPVPRSAPAPGDGASTRSRSAAPQRSLAEAFDEVIADEARKEGERRKIRESRWRQAGLGLVLALLTGASGYVWFGKPAFLTTPIDPVVQPATPVATRRTLVSVSLLIDDFRTTTGRLPQSLTELNVAVPTIAYLPHANGEFELRFGGGVHATILRGGLGHSELEVEELRHE